MRGALATALLALASPAAAADITVIVHARALPVSAPPVDDATIVMSAGRIVSITAHGAVPAGARVIDAGNRTVTPGLVDPATQLGLVEVLSAADTDDRSVQSGPLGAAYDVSPALNPDSVLLPVARADGVTRALSYPGGTAVSPFAGQAALIRLKPGGNILERARAAMVATIGDGTQAGAGGSRAAQWNLLRDALVEARRFPAQRGQTGPRNQRLSRADAEALAPVLAGTMPLAIRTDRASDIREAVRLAADEKVRVVILGGTGAWEVADALAAAHIPVILDPQDDLPQSFDWMGARLDNAAILAKAGVTIAFSVSGNGIYLSYDAGVAMREGAGIAVANGLPYADALRAITLAPAAIWGIPSAGRIAPGADADLVIWDGDPLEPASAPTAVFIAGTPVSLETRLTQLRDRYAPVHDSDPVPPAYR